MNRLFRHCLCVLGLAASAAFAQNPAAPATGPTGPAPEQPQDNVKVERLPNGDIVLGGITVHRSTGELSFPASIVLQSGVLEVLIATPEGRLHESLLKTDVKPLHLQTALYLINLRNGPRFPDANGNQGDLVDIDLEWTDKDGKLVREPVEAWIRDERSKKQMQRFGWVFVGSSIVDGAFQAEIGGNLVLVYSPADTILEVPDKSGDDDLVYVANEAKKDPGKDGKVRVILKPRKKK